MVAAQADRRVVSAHERRYGLFATGCAPAEALATLVIVHGRDRGPEELPEEILAMSGDVKLRVLAPWVEPRSWYDGRYDAPLSENLAARDLGLDRIEQAVVAAAGEGVATIILAGFSQGGCMAAEFLLTRGAGSLTGAAIFTGSVLAPDTDRKRGAAALDGLPIALSGGLEDPWLPAADLVRTGELLSALGARTTLATFKDQDHVVRKAEIGRLLELVSAAAATHPDGSASSDHPPAL